VAGGLRDQQGPLNLLLGNLRSHRQPEAPVRIGRFAFRLVLVLKHVAIEVKKNFRADHIGLDGCAGGGSRFAKAAHDDAGEQGAFVPLEGGRADPSAAGDERDEGERHPGGNITKLQR